MKIGLTLPIAEPDFAPMPRYEAVRRAALDAERDGFDSIWVFDHLLYRWEGQPDHGIWEAWTILAALAEATDRVELGTLVTCTPFRNPALLAKMADAVDEVSGGRLILGLGAGWHEPEFVTFGYPFDHLASRFEDALRIIAPLVRTGAVNYEGTYERAVDCASLPRGPRPEGPPLLIGAARPRMLRLTAEFADAWNTCWLARASELPQRVAPVREACLEVGRDPASLEITVGQMVTFPGLPEHQNFGGRREQFEFSEPEELAAEWRAFAEQGVSHLIVWKTPHTAECHALVAAALRAYREGEPV